MNLNLESVIFMYELAVPLLDESCGLALLPEMVYAETSIFLNSPPIACVSMIFSVSALDV